METTNKYPVRDCTIMDTYLIDTGWELQPYIDGVSKKDVSMWSFSTMGLIARTYKKDDKAICIGIMLAGIPIHVWYKQKFYYMPAEDPEKFFEDMMTGKLECITSILYKKKLAENSKAKYIVIN